MVSGVPWAAGRAARPMLLLSAALGLAPVRVSADGALLPSWGAVLWAGLLGAGLATGAAFYLSAFSLAPQDDIDVTKTLFTDILQTMMTYMSALCTICLAVFVLRRRLGPLVALVAAVDRALFADRASLYRSDHRRLLLLLGLLGAILTAFLAYEATLDADALEDAYEWLVFYGIALYPAIVCTVLDAQIFVSIVTFKSRFCRVNQYFETLLGECHSRSQAKDSFLNGSLHKTNILSVEGEVDVERRKKIEGHMLLDEKMCRTVFSDVFYGGSTPPGDKAVAGDAIGGPPGLNTLFRSHDALCDGLEQLNDIFGIQMLVELLRLFVDTICSVFFTVKLGIAACVHALLLDVMMIIALSISGYKCTAAANRTATLVSRVLLEPMSPSARRLLARFAAQLAHARTRICACGLLALDSALLAQTAGAVATYTVILVQYKGAHVGETAGSHSEHLNATLNTPFIPVNDTYSLVNDTLSLGSQ